MNGQKYHVGAFSHSLRCHLMNEHLGQLNETQFDVNINVSDPVAVYYRNKLVNISSNNLEIIYELVFQNEKHILPIKQTNYTTEQRETEPLSSYKEFEKLKDIKGHMVKFSGRETGWCSMQYLNCLEIYKGPDMIV